MKSPLASAKLGEAFEGRPCEYSLARVLAFSGGFISEQDWPHKNLHTDLKSAQEAGLKEIIASGTQSEGVLVSLLIDLFGITWLEQGVMDVKVINSVYVDDIVQAKAILKERTNKEGVSQALLDVSCEKQDGTKVIVGTAICSIT
jgi:acyl dehydratase